ncbi:hypothetical protein AAG906_027918 [Vitis piasezkii]
MKYVFNANIPIGHIQLTDDGDVKFFIGLNCTNGKLYVPLCITIDKELNGNSMLMHKSRHIHCELVETLTVDGENGPRFQNESLEGYKVHDWILTLLMISNSAHSVEILTMIDTNDGFIHDNSIIIEGVANEGQNIMQQPIVSGISDDHLEEHQIYSTKYSMTLFIIACKDGNNQIYPLTFGIGDSENDASWEWFLQKLHDAIGHIDDFFVISDRYGSIEKAVHKVFPFARHGTKFKNPVIHKFFHDATHAYRVLEFNFIFGQLETIDPRAARYLMDIGVDRWAPLMLLKNARDLPVLQLVGELRNLLQKWFVTRQQQAMSISTELTMWADGELRLRYNMSVTYLVEPINSKECNVKYVDISAQILQHFMLHFVLQVFYY